MDIENGVRAGKHKVLVAAVEVRSTEVVGGKMQLLDGSPHGAVEHQNPLAQRSVKLSCFIALYH
jgi:hypothetical protein